MSVHNILKLSCACGAQIIFEEALNGDDAWYGKATLHREAFLKAHEVCRTKATTPEDAACKLAIELFKSGVLSREIGS